MQLRFVHDAAARVDSASLEVAITDDVGVACAYSAWHAGRGWVHIPDVVDFSFDSASSVVHAHVERGGTQELAIDAYYGMGLPLALQATRRQEVIHASANASSSGVIGFCGASQQGKSTIAHGLALRGHALWADDALAFKTQLESVLATALPFKPKLRPATLDFFDSNSAEATEDAPMVPAWSTSKLRALFVLTPLARTNATERIEVSELSAGEALGAILPHGFRFKPTSTEHDNATLTAYADLVTHTPVFRMSFVRKLDGLASLLDRIEKEIR